MVEKKEEVKEAVPAAAEQKEEAAKPETKEAVKAEVKEEAKAATPAVKQPPHAHPAPNTGAMVGIDLKNINNEQYVGELAFGGSQQKIPVMFDTGSAMIYVLTDNC